MKNGQNQQVAGMIESLIKYMNSRIWKINPRDIKDVPFQYNLQGPKS